MRRRLSTRAWGRRTPPARDGAVGSAPRQPEPALGW